MRYYQATNGNAIIVRNDRTCRFRPGWCPFVSVPITRKEAVESILNARRCGIELSKTRW
jgi:galactose-1-phosphate uridylyltransferase